MTAEPSSVLRKDDRIPGVNLAIPMTARSPTISLSNVPPTFMSIVVALDTTTIDNLDLTPAISQIDPLLKDNAIVDRLGSIRFNIDYTREVGDPRELSEIPEVRLWFVRLDARYPYLPILLDWKAGELVRYAAMLVPHEFHRTEGIQYNPEALEIFLMGKIFTLLPWLDDRGIPSTSRLQAMAQMFGYELDAELFDRLRSSYTG